MVSIDFSLFAEILLFIILVFTLNHLLYQPVLSKMNERKKQLYSEEELTRQTQREETALITDIDDKLLEAHRSAEETSLKSIAEMEKQNADLLNSTCQELETSLGSHRHNIQNTILQVKSDLKPGLVTIAREIIRKLLPGLLFILLIGMPLFAQSQHNPTRESDHKSDHESEETGISEVARAVDFILMLGLLVYLTKKPIRLAFVNRIELIRKAFQDSSRAFSTAKERLEAVLSRHQKIDMEIKNILLNSQMQTQKTTQKLQCEQEKKITKIRSEAQKQMDLVSREALREVNSEVVLSAMKLVKSQITSVVDEQTDRKLVNDCIRQLDRMISDSRKEEHG